MGKGKGSEGRGNKLWKRDMARASVLNIRQSKSIFQMSRHLVMRMDSEQHIRLILVYIYLYKQLYMHMHVSYNIFK